ncbi:MAG: hypothetical protein M3525_10980 [Acidobacteriota bacterium]|nr:hypothetical protein [Acidobacteriota bacterium]
MKLNIFTIFTILLLPLAVFSQSSKAQPNQWKGLTLDESTAEQAIEKLGKPKTDKMDKVRIPEIGQLLTKDLSKKKWRILNFKEIESVKNALLVFDANNKLVLIHFELKDLAPQAFVNAYDNVSFKPTFSGIDQAFSPGDFSRDGSGNIYARNYPTVYFLIGQSEKSFVLGMVGNSSFGSVLKKTMGVPDSTLSYPGKVLVVELISRTLENKQGIELLK